ncbi:HTH domain-containing protein [Bacillus sp. NPDC077411]|uniref:HTH domain-containing protein n=1 Tax=Bacillus bruguierae TaxID=3127667 RepID=A0ABU8FIJ1_9BACI
MKQLEKNENVLKVSERSISYCLDFKIKAVKENQKGKGPNQIFLENGFDLDIIGEKKPNQCLKRWRKTYEQFVVKKVFIQSVVEKEVQGVLLQNHYHLMRS